MNQYSAFSAVGVRRLLGLSCDTCKCVVLGVGERRGVARLSSGL